MIAARSPKTRHGTYFRRTTVAIEASTDGTAAGDGRLCLFWSPTIFTPAIWPVRDPDCRPLCARAEVVAGFMRKTGMAAMEAQFIQHSTNKGAHGEKDCARLGSGGWRTLLRHREYLHVPLMFLAHTCTVQDLYMTLYMFMHIMMWGDNLQAVANFDLPYSTHKISHTIITHLILFLIVNILT